MNVFAHSSSASLPETISRSKLIVCLLLGLVIAGALLFIARGSSVQSPGGLSVLARDEKKTLAPSAKTQVASAYGKLPLSFETEPSAGSAGRSFVARGRGYSISLGSTRTVLNLRKPVAALGPQTGVEAQVATSVVDMTLKGSRPGVAPKGLEVLPGKINYLVGNDSARWRADIATYAKVAYASVYPGIDLVYYGNQQQLEYDFMVQPGADARQIRLQFGGARKLSVSRGGDLVVSTAHGEIRLLKPLSYQEVHGTRREVNSSYVIRGDKEVALLIGAYDRTLPLVIDPVLAYSTYLGGTDEDTGFGIAVDSLGNAYITGQTASSDFPATSFQTTTGGGLDVFVTKLNPAGTAIVYSTFVGGSGYEVGNGIAVDGAGNAYVSGQTTSTNFPLASPLHATFSGVCDAFAFELNTAGSGMVYSTYLGGSSFDAARGIAVDPAGNSYVVGEADSRDFPTTNPFQPNKSGNAVFKSINSAGSWAPSETGLLAFSVSAFAFDPANASILYAGADNGIHRSIDGGSTWAVVANHQIPALVVAIAIEPSNPSIIYAATTQGIYKSTDGASNFALLPGTSNVTFRGLVIDPVVPTTIYAVAVSARIYKSTNGGSTWSTTTISGQSITQFNAIAIDTSLPGTLYVGTNRGVFKSTNSAGSWTAANAGIEFELVRVLTIDRTNSATLYAGSNSGIFKSTNGGTIWIKINGNLGFLTVNNIVLDPGNANVLYMSAFGTVYKTIDGGTNWNAAVNGYSNNQVSALTMSPASSSTLFVGTSSRSEAFVTKISPGGANQLYSTYLGGGNLDVAYAVAVNPLGQAYITGATASADFPLLNPLQSTPPLSTDAFITKLDANGALAYSTFFGGDSQDQGEGIALDGSNNVLIAGDSFSTTLPGPGGPVPSITGGTTQDGFVAKLNASGSAILYTRFVGGNFGDQCLGLAVDSAGSAYVTGVSSNDAFVAKLTPSGSIAYSISLGGSDADTGTGIAVNSSGNVYITGWTDSGNFPTVNPVQSSRGGGEAFVARLTPAADLAVTISDAPDPVAFGSDLTYNIRVTNSGEITATGVLLTDSLPAGATLVSVTPTQGSCTGTVIVSCSLGSLASGSQADVTLIIKPPAIVNLSNTATALANEADSNTANNSATSTTQVQFADLSLENSSLSDVAAVGSTVAFVVGVQNKSGLTATGVTLNYTLPAGITFVSCNSIGACGGSGNNRTVTFSSLAVGAAAGASIIGTIDNSVGIGSLLNATATVSSSLPDPDAINNSAIASVTTSASLVKTKLNGQIVYSTDATGTLGLRTINPDGTGASPLTNAQNYERRPAWSPDGKKVAFQSFTPGNPSVYEISVVNSNGSGRLKLTNIAAADARPTWSPNGKRIAFVGNDSSIYTVSPNGGATVKLINNSLTIHQLDWSPEGTKLAFESNGEIYSVSLAGTQLKLTNHPGQNTDANPRWSPDGSRVLFNRSAAAWVVNLDGSNEHKLLNQSGTNFTWSADGLRLAFELSGEINVVNLDSTGLLQLTNNNATPGFVSYKFEPDWQPIPTLNPADDALFYVRQQYADFLNREPDSSGLSFWYNEIASCGTNQQCLELKRINVSAAFYLSIEFQGTGYLVERMYKAAYGAATGNSTFPTAHTLPVPVVRFSEFLSDTQQIGRGVVVGQTGWEAALENNKQAFAGEFVQRARFTTALPLTLTPGQFVDRLNSNAGTPLSQSERDQLVTDLTNNLKNRSQVLRDVAEHPNLVSLESNRAFVLMQFFGYLRRNPNDPQDTDYTGYDFWLTKLNQFNGNFVNAEMVKAFISSTEYRQRFGP